MRYQLGVLAVENEEFPPFGKQSFFFEDMIRSYNQGDIKVLFFSPLHWKQSSMIDGYEFINDQWNQVKGAIPQLIYDRAFSKSEEEKSQIERCRAWLSKTDHHLLNPFDLAHLLNNKIEFHKFLQKHKIPTLKTYPIGTNEIIKEDLSFTENRIYLKPNFGSKGEGIYVIEKLPDGFNLIDRIGKSTFFKTLKKLNDFLKLEPLDLYKYFLQEEASVKPIDQAPFDIRVLVQNYGEEFKITGMGVRIGQKHSVTANLNSGGKAIPVDDLETFLKTEYQKELLEVVKDIEQICLKTSLLLEKKFGSFLEIGFDILITQEGPIIIEGNAKPSRWIFNVIADELESKNESSTQYKNLRNETVRVPLQYASFCWMKRNKTY